MSEGLYPSLFLRRYLPLPTYEFPYVARNFVDWAGQYNVKTRCKRSGRPLIKTSKRNGSSVQTALYYVRLRTHEDHPLFQSSNESPPDYSQLSDTISKIVADELLQAADSHRGVSLEQWVLEPDSLHAIVSLHEDRPSQESKGKPRLLTSFVAGLKAATAKRINLIRSKPGSSVWHRSYQEQRVEDEMMLARLCKKLNESNRAVTAG